MYLKGFSGGVLFQDSRSDLAPQRCGIAILNYRERLKKDLGYHRLSQLSKELQRAAAPYFFIYSHSLLEARPELQPVGNVVEDSSHE